MSSGQLIEFYAIIDSTFKMKIIFLIEKIRGNFMGFKIAARALRQLGAELITSDHIALNELIKNSLDAKSKRVAIKVDNPFLLGKVRTSS